MALPTMASFGDVLIELGQGDGPPETFTAPCAIRESTMNWESQSSEVSVDDCASPTAVAHMIRNKTDISFTLSGNGILNMADLQSWREWWMSATPKNVRFNFALPAGDGGGYFEAPCNLRSANINTAKRTEGGKAIITVEIESAGTITWTDAS